MGVANSTGHSIATNEMCAYYVLTNRFGFADYGTNALIFMVGAVGLEPTTR